LILARRSKFSHPQAGEIELPLLIPAFSSKGFAMYPTGRGNAKRYYSENAYALSDFGKNPNPCVLISGYDLHFHHFDAPELAKGKPQIHLRNSSLVFLDSGGYELVSEFDSMEIKTPPYTALEGYGPKEYEKQLKNLVTIKEPLPLVITNFDYTSRGKPLENQIKTARTLFRQFPDCTTDFIIKPWTPDSKVVDPARMSDRDFANLQGFDIIGITEKELGRDMFDRLKRIARLRKGLDEANINSPIHVWGGLDPLITPLFFFAGAEIFDGVSWLRYAYHEGMAVNRETYSVISDIGVTASRQFNHTYVSFRNLAFLNNLTNSLQQWVDFDGKKFDMFDPHIMDCLKLAYRTMTSKIQYLQGEA
jgi:hypothetical protein